MTTGRINQVHASPQATTHSRHLRVSECVRILVALHQKLNPNFRSATLCATLLAIKTYTLTPELKTPRHATDVMGSPSRLRYYMLHMLSFAIQTLTLSAYLSTTLITSEVTTPDTSCSPTTDLSHISWWSRVGLQRYNGYILGPQSDAYVMFTGRCWQSRLPKTHVMFTGRRWQSRLPQTHVCSPADAQSVHVSHTTSQLGSSRAV